MHCVLSVHTELRAWTTFLSRRAKRLAIRFWPTYKHCFSVSIKILFVFLYKMTSFFYVVVNVHMNKYSFHLFYKIMSQNPNMPCLKRLYKKKTN